MTSTVIQSAGIREVAVIGLGLMGSGIAELVARSGRRVVAIEINQDFLDQGMARLNASLDRAVSRGKLTGTAREEMVTRIRRAADIAAGVADADLVIEAIPERMDLKRTLYAQLDEACRADAILATNTSSLSITEIAGGTQHPRPGSGAALLQSRSGHEAGRGHLHGAHLAGDRRDAGPAGPGPGQDTRPGQ